MNMTTVPSDKLKEMQQQLADKDAEIAALKDQVAQLERLVSRYSKWMRDNLAEALKGQETIAQQAEAIRVAAEQIRRCDYTPARSTLLNASSPEILQARDERVAEACKAACENKRLGEIIGDSDQAYENAITHCSQAIDSKEWIKYL